MNIIKLQSQSNFFINILSRQVRRIEETGAIRRKDNEPECLEFLAVKSDKTEDYFRNIKSKKIAEVIWDGSVYKKIKYIFAETPVIIYFSNPDNFGINQIIRTGDAEFRAMILKALRQRGYYLSSEKYLEKHSNDYLRNQDGKLMATNEEIDIFKLSGLTYMKPERRKK